MLSVTFQCDFSTLLSESMTANYHNGRDILDPNNATKRTDLVSRPYEQHTSYFQLYLYVALQFGNIFIELAH